MPTPTTINTIGLPFIQLNAIESTNTYAMQMLQLGVAKHGYTVFAHNQTAGKGQMGKVWNSEPNSNIIVSAVLDTSFLPLQQQFFLSVAISNAVHSFFAKYAGEETKIKWPNDVYWQNRKAGGILIENVVRGTDWKWGVVGIGLNINQSQFPSHIANGVSLKQITGKNFDVVDLAQELCNVLEVFYQRLKAGEIDNLLADYNNHLFKKGEEVKLRKDNAVFNCTIDKVDKNGKLLVSKCLYNEFNFGEIEWVI